MLVLRAKDCNDIKTRILFHTGTVNKRRLLNVNGIHKNKGNDVYSVLRKAWCCLLLVMRFTLGQFLGPSGSNW